MKKLLLAVGLIGLVSSTSVAQKRDFENYRKPDKRGLNVFEDPKEESNFEGLNVRMGGAFALQYQAIEHKNSGAVELIGMRNNFNLATANLDLDAELADGIRLHLRTYLSSRHHPEPYVKGGYMQVDNLNFIQEGFLEDIMDKLTIRVGHMENNYGDAHFRRSDNAQALYNPFVGNLIMDSFTTEVGGELTYQNNGWLGVVGVTNGKLNQAVGNVDANRTKGAFLAKLGYDTQVDEDLRLRLTGSVYYTSKAHNVYLYSADRAGGRYYFVMEEPGATSAGAFRSGRFDPALTNEITAIMINPFVKYKGLEFFGVYERATGKAISESSTRSFDQFSAELLYRFGANEDFYIGGRYNLVKGEQFGTGNDIEIDRFNIGGGWFLTDNIMAKLEYVKQTYSGFDATSKFDGGKFDGIMLEAVISF